MPVHDWTRVSAGTFHHFHTLWIAHLTEALNAGLLPGGYYAMAEQHARMMIADILTLQHNDRTAAEPLDSGSVAVAEAPPRVSRKMTLSPSAAYRRTRRTIAIRHSSDHRIVALLEIVSPANKDRPTSVGEFVDKAVSALDSGIHLLVIDLHPPGRHDPHGIHGAIWDGMGSADEEELPDKPFVADKLLTLAAYVSRELPEAYVEPIAVGDTLPDMPLFLDWDRYVNVPLERTYLEAYRGVPAYWRGIIEGKSAGTH